MSSCVRYEETSKRDFVRLYKVARRAKLVLVRPIRGNKQAGLGLPGLSRKKGQTCHRLSGTRKQASGLRLPGQSLKKGQTYPHPFGTRKQASRTTSAQTKSQEGVNLSSSVWYKETSKRDFVRPYKVARRGKLVHVRSARGNKQVRLRSLEQSRKKGQTCPHPSGTRKQASGTLSTRTKSQEGANLSLSIRY